MAAFAALTLNFFIPRLMPGDPATIIFARFRGKLKPEALDALRETFGLNDDSLIDQYFSYLKSILCSEHRLSWVELLGCCDSTKAQRERSYPFGGVRERERRGEPR